MRIVADAVPGYAATLPAPHPGTTAAPLAAADPGRGDRAAFWLSLDAINFGSGWFPELRKDPGRSGYRTIAAAWERRFGGTDGDAPRAAELARITTAEVAAILGQDPDHELMELYALSLRDLGERLGDGFGGSALALVDAAGGSAVALAAELGGWPCYADRSHDGELSLPFLKRAQIAAADLQRAGVVRWHDADRLTMFADNLVPHVLRLDGVLAYSPPLVARIEAGRLIEHGSPEEVEIRACAVETVERLVVARAGAGLTAADIDAILWERGGGRRYKAAPRHRSRCTAY